MDTKLQLQTWKIRRSRLSLLSDILYLDARATMHVHTFPTLLSAS